MGPIQRLAKKWAPRKTVRSQRAEKPFIHTCIISIVYTSACAYEIGPTYVHGAHPEAGEEVGPEEDGQQPEGREAVQTLAGPTVGDRLHEKEYTILFYIL
jgi:hypothetical protein